MDSLHPVLLFIILFSWKVPFGFANDGCITPQYLEVGKPGLISCSFEEPTAALLWYNATNTDLNSLILKIYNNVLSGKGYEAGDYDIYPNGSLKINNVSFMHDRTFTVVRFSFWQYSPVTYDVTIITIGQTFSRIPVISNCSHGSKVCFQILDQSSEISCTIRDARPGISLTWVVRTIESDRNLSSALVFRNGTYPFVTSHVTVTNPFAYTEMLTLLVCKANGPIGLLERNESLLLLKNHKAIKKVNLNRIHVQKDSRLQLPCTDSQVSYLVWQVNRSSGNVLETIIYAVFLGENFTRIIGKDYKLLNTSSLVVDYVGVRHEGTYQCISGNGFEDDVAMFEVLVFVHPNPAYLVIDGCDHQQYCVLEAHVEGSLTCTVKGIRPAVDLDIKEVFERPSDVLYFNDKSTSIKESGDTFDVIFTSRYSFVGASGSRITVECKVLDAGIKGLHLSTKFDLLFLQGAITATEQTSSSSPEGNRTWVTAVVLTILLVLVACGLVKVLCKRWEIRKRTLSAHRMTNHVETETATFLSYKNRRKDPSKAQFHVDSKEDIPMIFKRHPSGLREMFIDELKAKYEDLYDAVQPIPYIRDRLYCVDRVFVEGGIECLIAKEKIEGGGTWEKLPSYHDIFYGDRVKSVRRIIEGEPGYGKSTLTLQLSYDWCNKIQQSYLKDTGMLILLRLRQLGGVKSIYRAIKQFILPKDTKLTESDVADIISNSSSVLVILDGYDEYPDQDDDIDSDVISIIRREMFQHFEVILTTRSSYLPKKYPALTKRLKLTGFDSNARDQYIRKAVVGDDVVAAEKIKQRLKENPVLGDLCQVPLFFVMFAHMSHESEQFEKFNSVTSFFRYMISCFHSHMKNKMEDENVQKFDLFEKDHRALDKLAFEGLSSKNQQIVWNKKDMCERLGQDFYDQYVRIGILVEEEVLDISDNPSSISCEHIQYKTEVRFYHKLFCEWYAAHHLSQYASRDDVNFDPYQDSESSTQSDSYEECTDDEISGQQEETDDNQNDHYLKYVDPFDLQYVYRFTCGLNPIASEKIIGYLKTRGDADNFVILCIFEKSGKVEDVLEDVEDLCSRGITIKSNNSLLLQRSTIQLLEIAITNQISISSVYLDNCYSTVNLSGGNHLQLKSNLSIPVLTTLNELTINTVDEGREITAEEFAGILQYSSKCLALKELEFWYCLLPQSVKAESVSVLRSRNVKVVWENIKTYQLNLQSCLWERVEYRDDSYHAVGDMTDFDYQLEVRTIRR